VNDRHQIQNADWPQNYHKIIARRIRLLGRLYSQVKALVEQLYINVIFTVSIA